MSLFVVVVVRKTKTKHNKKNKQNKQLKYLKFNSIIILHGHTYCYTNIHLSFNNNKNNNLLITEQ